MQLLISFQGLAQISGIVTDQAGSPIPGISVIETSSGKGVVTGVDGEYTISILDKTEVTLEFSGVGFISQTRTITPETNGSKFDVLLEESTTFLESVVVTGKSQATKVREQAYAVEVVESKGFKNLTTNANEILGKISGVNIRQSGGLGSQFSVSLNGLSGNQLRIFLDGVPMDYFGTSLSLNNFSANLIERIEVYKGVVPIHLSSDALGGAINVITGQKTNSYMDASYSIGSFGTHIASLNTQYRHPNSGLVVRLKSFMNTSQNDYKVPVNLVNRATGKADDESTWVRRFHDAYNSKMAWAETGFIGTPFADQLLMGIMFSENFKELQQPANAIGQAKVPYGDVHEEEEKYITNFSYNKSGLFNNRLNIRAYAVGVFSKKASVDTSSYRYDWSGGKELKTDVSRGEIEGRKTLFTRNLKNYLANINAEYEIASNHNVAFNYSLNNMILNGSDPFKAANNTQFSHPSTVGKQVFGLSYSNSLLNKKVQNSLFAKSYRYFVSSLETDYGGNEVLPFTETKTRVGYGFTSTLHLDNFQIKASYENATRLPELIELFGDGLNSEPAPTLLPEKSNNYNLGVIYTSRSPNHLMVSVNGFIRDAEDFILPIVQGIKVYHHNNGLVLAKGIDLGSSFNYGEHLVFSLNATYLDKRDNDPWRNGAVGTPSSQYKIRIPNEPYLFANFNASYRRKGIINQKDNLSISLSENFVHEFYYRWENLASRDKGIVPSQWTTNLDLVYSLNNEMLNFSFGMANLFDARVYDNFYQLRPGRTYNLKIRYFIN